MAHDEQRRTSCRARITIPTARESAFTPLNPPARTALPNSIYLLDDSGNSDLSLFGFIRVPWAQGWSDADAA
ncbi:hypothetical protein GCM10010274_14100 [Streptomyces lavendofoliae]|uniref:Uncharacterized protein n=1 Tax=Streptomyces lavendofoliae TaxID=67314 RepID=A0A918HUE8_9ACTN|nr:hypothetical protein GCM10010274_14100 [Streptomyces lavendofoliae]